MASQAALHPALSNPFIFADFHQKGIGGLSQMGGDIHDLFEAGKVIIIDGLPLERLDFFLNHPGRFYHDWIPPIFSNKIRKQISSAHALHAICNNDDEILSFQNNLEPFEESWTHFLYQIFHRYQWDHMSFSYRFNHLMLGSLHLDVPDMAYEGHQFRWFVNLDSRPRILALGPTIFEIAEQYWFEKKLHQFADLPVHEFIGALRSLTLDKTVNREREMPRHYLTLDPGALWLSHSSYISHGIVYGRKTACFEGHIRPESLKNPRRHFNSMIRALQKYGPATESIIETRAANIF